MPLKMAELTGLEPATSCVTGRTRVVASLLKFFKKSSDLLEFYYGCSKKLL